MPEVILPRTECLGDYVSVVSRLITIFAEAAGRGRNSRSTGDLVTADRDVVRARVTETDDGSLTLNRGVDLISGTRDLVLAAACSLREPQTVARRMAETAAHLVDHVPARANRSASGWCRFPYPLRFLFATRPAVLTQVLAIVYRAISTFLTRRAGLRVGTGARTGAVTLIQRFGSALNLNIHLHMLVVDGAYTFETGTAPLARCPRPGPA